MDCSCPHVERAAMVLRQQGVGKHVRRVRDDYEGKHVRTAISTSTTPTLDNRSLRATGTRRLQCQVYLPEKVAFIF